MGHKIVFPGAHLGHSWGTVGAVTWGTLGAHLGQKQLGQGHTGTVGAKKFFCKLNTLGAHLGHKVTWGTLGADTVGDQLGHIWDKND